MFEILRNLHVKCREVLAILVALGSLKKTIASTIEFLAGGEREGQLMICPRV